MKASSILRLLLAPVAGLFALVSMAAIVWVPVALVIAADHGVYWPIWSFALLGLTIFGWEITS